MSNFRGAREDRVLSLHRVKAFLDPLGRRPPIQGGMAINRFRPNMLKSRKLSKINPFFFHVAGVPYD